MHFRWVIVRWQNQFSDFEVLYESELHLIISRDLKLCTLLLQYNIISLIEFHNAVSYLIADIQMIHLWIRNKCLLFCFKNVYTWIQDRLKLSSLSDITDITFENFLDVVEHAWPGITHILAFISWCNDVILQEYDGKLVIRRLLVQESQITNLYAVMWFPHRPQYQVGMIMEKSRMMQYTCRPMLHIYKTLSTTASFRLVIYWYCCTRKILIR